MKKTVHFNRIYHSSSYVYLREKSCFKMWNYTSQNAFTGLNKKCNAATLLATSQACFEPVFVYILTNNHHIKYAE